MSRLWRGALWGLALAFGLGAGYRAFLWAPAETGPPALTVSAPVAEEAGPIQAVRVTTPAELGAARAEGAVLTLKEDSGELHFVSSLSLALDCGASGWDVDQNTALAQAAAQGEARSIALVSCLRDDALASARPDLALRRASGSPWRDSEGLAWLDPEKEEVQVYLIGLCREIAQLGFDEIVLTHCAYPTQGDTDDLRRPADPTGQLETFLRRLAGALADFPVSLSLVAEGDCLEADAPSGQSQALLAILPGRVWAEAADREALSGLDPILLPEN
jgi:hypothetical protein